VHSDFTKEVPPKFEIFDDRIEITSTGSLPDGLSQDEFFEGYSIPRNKEIMRVFKDLELVEQLGSGIPRILDTYDKNCFNFTENFLRMTFMKGGQEGGQEGGQKFKLTDRQTEVLNIIIINPKISRKELSVKLKINESAIQKHLNALKKKKKIIRDGETTGKWIIL